MTMLRRRNLRAVTTRVTFLDGSNTPDTNGAAAAHFVNGLSSMQQSVDLSTKSECRLIIIRRSTAASGAGYVVELMYAASYDGTPGNFATIGSSVVQCDANVTSTEVKTSWIPILWAARADVVVCPIASGGDGVADPNFGVIAAEFR